MTSISKKIIVFHASSTSSPALIQFRFRILMARCQVAEIFLLLVLNGTISRCFPKFSGCWSWTVRLTVSCWKLLPVAVPGDTLSHSWSILCCWSWMARLAIACPEGDVVILLSTLKLWQVCPLKSIIRRRSSMNKQWSMVYGQMLYEKTFRRIKMMSVGASTRKCRKEDLTP